MFPRSLSDIPDRGYLLHEPYTVYRSQRQAIYRALKDNPQLHFALPMENLTLNRNYLGLRSSSIE